MNRVRSASPPSVVVALLALVVATAACRGKDPDGEPPLPDTSAMQPQVARAIEQARTAVLEQQSADAWGGLAAVCDVHELLDCAERSYRRASTLEPDAFRWVYLLALVRERRGATVDEVLGLLERAGRIDPTFAPREVRVGDAAMRAGRLDAARDAYERATRLDPRLAAAWLGLAQSLVDLDRADEALDALNRAARLGGLGRRVLALRARALARLGRHDESAAAAADARDAQPLVALVDPHRSWVSSFGTGPAQAYSRARRLMDDGHWAEALEQLEIVLDSDPNFASLHHRIGICLARLGRADEALEQLERALELKPELTDARGMRGALLLQRGRFDEAAAELARVSEESPGHPAAVAGLASALSQIGRESDAIDALRRGASVAPLDADGEYLLGTLLLRAGEADEAALHCGNALELDSTHARARHCLEQARTP